ncbi:MAG TPA: zinc ribbon domain-containing protein [Acidobacteriota bacterium]|nr:zinc ribbon domain-containing protein [Acidobacteriota bacterium]HRR56828.1 zinc ribbon domain-containing protein [Acidobacteriota bacterium]HRV08426.1 zinc ribbon domain-containing protein [Acidobacteriota bacterium]
MPIFEYRCRSCGDQFERIVRTPDEGVICPDCGSGDVDKLFSSFAVRSASAVRAGSDQSPCCQCGAAETGACPGMRSS